MSNERIVDGKVLTVGKAYLWRSGIHADFIIFNGNDFDFADGDSISVSSDWIGEIFEIDGSPLPDAPTEIKVRDWGVFSNDSEPSKKFSICTYVGNDGGFRDHDLMWWDNCKPVSHELAALIEKELGE